MRCGRVRATHWRNLVLAGDWTRTGLPATIEGAIRSGATRRRPAARAPDGQTVGMLETLRIAASNSDIAAVSRGNAGVDSLPAPRRPLAVRARSRRHHSGGIYAAAASSRRPIDDTLEAEIGIYSRRSRVRMAAGRCLQDGDFDMSASVKAYFALKMIGDDLDAPHMRARPRGDPRRGGAAQPTYSPAPAGALRRSALAAVPAMPVEIMLLPRWFPSISTRSLIGPHRDRAAVGADGEEAAGPQPGRRPR